MKTLYLLRHAKSSRDFMSMDDFDRPLNERGYVDAHATGNYLNKKKLKVDVIISSPAIRAFTTAVICAKHIGYHPDRILLRYQLYESAVKDYLNCIAAVENGDSILLAGHNNTISEVAQKLSMQRVNELKTSAVIAIQLAIDSWKNILTSQGKVLFEVDPSMIKEV